MLPELLTMIGDDDDEGVVQNSELLELVDELFQAPVVVQDFAITSVDGFLDEAVGVDSIAAAHRTADDRASTVPSFVDEAP
jgi:hypothetical protein